MDFKLPDIGEGVHEGELVKWLVKEGDSVSIDQPMVEVMTDKATVEIPISSAGKVTKLLAKEGETIKVGQVIATLDGAGGEAKASAPAKAAPTPEPAPAPKKAPAPQAASAPHRRAEAAMAEPAMEASEDDTAEAGRVQASPATRRLARELGISLASVSGTGPNGRVLKEDVLKVSNGGGASQARETTVAVQSTNRGETSMPARATRSVPSVPETLIPFRGIRRKIAEAMSKSRFTIPEFTYVDECEISELVEFRKEAKAMADEQGIKLTYMPFITKAVIRALKEFPYMNSILDEAGGNIVVKNYYNIGMAVDTDDGLVVPVVKNADQKSILELAAEIQSLAEKARTKKLSLDNLQDGTFTITNAGTIGGMLATPVINWPEVGILGVHKISKRPIVKTIEGVDEIAIGQMIWLSVAVDHRVVDGAVAARFMNVVMKYLSSPKLMLLELS